MYVWCLPTFRICGKPVICQNLKEWQPNTEVLPFKLKASSANL